METGREPDSVGRPRQPPSVISTGSLRGTNRCPAAQRTVPRTHSPVCSHLVLPGSARRWAPHRPGPASPDAGRGRLRSPTLAVVKVPIRGEVPMVKTALNTAEWEYA